MITKNYLKNKKQHLPLVNTEKILDSQIRPSLSYQLLGTQGTEWVTDHKTSTVKISRTVQSKAKLSQKWHKTIEIIYKYNYKYNT